MNAELTMDDIDIYEVDGGWLAFRKGGRELARSHSYDLLMSYLEDAVLPKRSRKKQGL